MGHLRPERLGDPAWVCACDLVVTRFLRDSRIGRIPYEYLAELPISAKGEDQAYEQLKLLPPERWGTSFSTMTNGRAALQGLRVIWRMYNAERNNTIADLRGLGLEQI